MTPPPQVNTKKPDQGVCWHMHVLVRDTMTPPPRVNPKMCWHTYVRVRDSTAVAAALAMATTTMTTTESAWVKPVKVPCAPK